MYIPNKIAIINRNKIWSSIGNPGGGGGLLSPGAGGDGTAKASVTPNRVMIKTKNLHTIAFIFI